MSRLLPVRLSDSIGSSQKPQAVSCTDLFSTVELVYQGRLRNSSILVEKRKRSTQPVVCFEGDLRQVLSNLFTNAIDVMPTGGRLILRSREGTDWRSGRKGALLTVADTGTGMSESTQAHIFEAFLHDQGSASPVWGFESARKSWNETKAASAFEAAKARTTEEQWRDFSSIGRERANFEQE